MCLPCFFTILSFVFSSAAFAQDMMPMGGGMGKPMMGKPMPEKMDDARQNIPLSETEKAIVMAEMRQMLSSIQGITEGLAQGDMQAVVGAAAKSGMAMMQEVPAQIRMKFPQAFAQMGMASHKAFDQIAQETKSIKDPSPVLRQLSAAMQNCVACHAAYRITPQN
jgi:hypothetical protein